MALDRIVSIVLRAAELVFAAIVAGVTGEYLHRSQGASSWELGRFIYTEVVAAVSIFLALIWLFPFSGSFIHWPVDIFVSILWWVSFGLLVNVSRSIPAQHDLHGGGVQELTPQPPAHRVLVRRRLRLAKRLAARRPVRQVQGRHRLCLPLGAAVARVGPHRHPLGAQARAPRRPRRHRSPPQVVPPRLSKKARCLVVTNEAGHSIRGCSQLPWSCLDDDVSWFFGGGGMTGGHSVCWQGNMRPRLALAIPLMYEMRESNSAS